MCVVSIGLTGPYRTRRCDLVVPADGGWGRSNERTKEMMHICDLNCEQ